MAGKWLSSGAPMAEMWTPPKTVLISGRWALRASARA